MGIENNVITKEAAEQLIESALLKQKQTDMEVSLAEIKGQIAQVITMIKEQNTKTEADQKEFKKEIENEFASKFDLERLENKLDKLWLRITVTVGTIVSAGLLIGWLLATANSIKTIIG